MSKTTDASVTDKDVVHHSEADDLDENNDGSQVTDTDEDDEEEDEGKDKGEKKPPAKKQAAKKAPAKKEEEEDEEDDEEEDDEEDEEEDDEEDDEEEDKGKNKGAKSNPRLERMRTQRDRAREELNAAQRRLAELENKQTDAAKEKLDKITKRRDELYDLVEDARAKGETKAAAKYQRELDEINANMTRSQAQYAAVRDAAAAAAVREYNATVRELESLDPRFDTTSRKYDEDLVNEVDELTQAFEARGMSPADALRKATKVVLREDPFAPGKRRASLDREERKTDKKTNAAAAKRQPVEEPGATREKANKQIDFSQMSEKDFDALPESKLRELDGSNG